MFDTLGSGDAIQAIKNAAGIATPIKRNKTANDTSLPWDQNGSNVKSRFFPALTIDGSRWDRLYPYRLVVVDSSKGNKIVVGKKGYDRDHTNYAVTHGTGSTTITFEKVGGWVFTLPITPQQLSIADQFAINTSATLRGVLEEHSGVRFKMINARGTMGVWPQRGSISKPNGTPGLIQSLFGGTLEAVGNVVGQVNKLVSAISGNHPANKPTSIRPEVPAGQKGAAEFGVTSTGYYQALALQQFLEQYAEAKLDPANASWRLVFDIQKQNQSFVVTPMQFTWQQDASKAMDISYNLQLKAWRRIDIKSATNVVPANNQPLSPGILQRILNTISAARSVLSASTSLIGAVTSDVEAPLEVLRQTSLFVKDLAGVAITMADMPNQIASDYSSSWATSVGILSNTIKGLTSDSKTSNSVNSISSSSSQNEGLSRDAIAGGQNGSEAATNQSLDAVNSIIKNPQKNFDLLNQVPVDSLSLSPPQQAAIDKVVEDARQTTVDTLKRYRNTIQNLATKLSNNFGTGDVLYSKIYNQPAPTKRLQPITLDEYDILKQLYDVMQSYDILTSTTDIDDQNKQTNMDYVAGLADLSGIPFNTTSAKILAPVPFGMTVEAIALRYLGDAQRWLEIVTLNNLRDPYIDETGFQLSLLSNATGRQITIGSTDNLYIGQRILLNSLTQKPAARTILSIDRLSDTSFLLTLDGLPDLDSFLTIDKAYLQAYLPGTVNSQQKIFIPSDLPVPDNSSIIPPPSTANDPLTGLSKVDWLLTDSGDIAINNFGDFRYSSGITNIIQALKIKFATKVGTMLTHPDFGLNITPGTISSDLQIQDLYNSINVMIQQDPRFSGISNLEIILNGPTLTINLGVSLPNQTGVFPVTFELAA